MVKTVLLYGSILAGIMLLLNSMEYFFWVRLNFVELYIGLLAAIFLGIGIWFGKRKTSTNIKEEPELKMDFQPNELGISKREFEVLVLVNKGLTNQEIADKLFVSNNTIKTHTSNLFEKLEVKNRTQAIIKAKEMGMLA